MKKSFSVMLEKDSLGLFELVYFYFAIFTALVSLITVTRT